MKELLPLFSIQFPKFRHNLKHVLQSYGILQTVFFLQHFLFFVSSMFPTDNIFLFLETLLRCSSISHPSLLVSRDSTIPYVFKGKKGVQSPLKKAAYYVMNVARNVTFYPVVFFETLVHGDSQRLEHFMIAFKLLQLQRKNKFQDTQNCANNVHFFATPFFVDFEDF